MATTARPGRTADVFASAKTSEHRSNRVAFAAGRYLSVAGPVYVGFFLAGEFHRAQDVLVATLFATLWLGAVLASFAAYRRELWALGMTPAVIRGTIVGVAAVSAADYWIHRDPVSRGWLVVIAAAIVVSFMTWESIAKRLLPPRRILIVGTGRSALELVRELADLPKREFEVVGLVSDGSETPRHAPAPILGDVSLLPRIVAEQEPELIVLAVERNRPRTFGYVLDSAGTSFRVLELPQFYEHALGRVPVRDLSHAWFMSVLHLYQRPHSRAAKRTFDIVVALLGLVFVAPTLLVTAWLVRRTPGAIILRQTRLGEHGKPFTIYKFRTMRDDAEAFGEAVWAADGDVRVTRAGGLLRRARLDEVPQLWNVLRGEMSIVGPRPERPEFLAQLQDEVPYWTRRHLIKPGITGWAQVRRGYTADVAGSSDKLAYDLWYLRHRSLMVDLAICAHTVRTVFGLAEMVKPARTNRRLAPVPADITD